MARRPIRGSATKQDTGKSCPFCRFPIKERDEVVACGECHSTHHEDCWEENGGCAVPDCAGAPAASGSGGGSGGSHIPPVAGPSKKKVTLDPRPELRRRKRQRQRKKAAATGKPLPVPPPPGESSKTTLWIAGAAIAFLAVIAVIMISNNFGDTDPASGKSCEEGTGKNGVPCYDNGKLPNTPTPDMQSQISRSVRSWFNLVDLGDYPSAWTRLSPRVRKQISQDEGYQGWRDKQVRLTKYLHPSNANVTLMTGESFPEEGVMTVYISNLPFDDPNDRCDQIEGVSWVVWDPDAQKWFYEPGITVSNARRSAWGYRGTKVLKFKC